MQPKKLQRLTEGELQELYKKKLTSDQKLLKSVLDEIAANNVANRLPEEVVNDRLTIYLLKQKHRWYLRMKRVIPDSINSSWPLYG